jgi:microcystin-dependent protein
VLRLRYEDFDKYGEGVFEIPIDRGPVIPSKLTQAGGAGYGLAIGHDPRVNISGLNTEVLDEMLSIKKEEGNGDAVRIENASDGTGLNIVQKGKGLAAKFSGSSGVEIEGKLNAKNDVKITGKLQIGQQDGTAFPSDNNKLSPTVDINKDLSLHLRLDDTNIYDKSTHQRRCTVQGSPEPLTDPQLGKCLGFSGSEKITCPGINLANSSFTIQFWAKRAEAQDSKHRFVIGQEEQGAPNKSLHIGFRLYNPGQTTPGKFTFAFYSNDLDTDIDYRDANWHHWACVYDYDKRSRTLYRDGRLVLEQNSVNPYIGTSQLLIGKAAPSSSDSANFKGNLADIRVHIRALSAAEVLLCMRSILTEQAQSNDRSENAITDSALVVEQSGNGLAAQFNGGSGVEITGNLQVGQRIRDKTGEIMPVGSVLPFAGKQAPDGWVLCNGQQVIGEKYMDLAKVLFDEERLIFNVPDYREKFIAGATGTGDYKLGASSGQASIALTEKQMPRHTHTIKDPGHKHTYRIGEDFQNWWEYRGGGGGKMRANGGDYSPDTSSIGTGISIETTGNSESHENRPPFVALNYIIKY